MSEEKREDMTPLEELVEDCDGRFCVRILRGKHMNEKYCKLIRPYYNVTCPYANELIVADTSCGNHEKLREVYRCDKCQD